jgi:Icc-related predicted phosphoesterase
VSDGEHVKILFTSDLHGQIAVYENFAKILKNLDYDLGIIAGDLIDDYLPSKQIMEFLGLKLDEYRHEVARYGEKYVRIKALSVKERNIKNTLLKAEKDILVVKGNHDLTDWKSEGNIKNINLLRRDIGKYNFVGYQYTEFDKTPRQHGKTIELIESLIDENTILVSHIPPYGVLDSTVVPTLKSYHKGSKEIRDLVKRKKPRLHLFGHVHTLRESDGKSINGSFQGKNKFLSISL